MYRQPCLFFGVQIVFLVFPSLIHCSYSGDFRVLLWKSGPAIVGETTTFRAEVELKPEARTKHNMGETLTFEFSWKVSSRPWIKHQKTTQSWDGFQWRWTEAGVKTVRVYVWILEHGHGFRGHSSYYASNETDVRVAVTESEAFGRPYLVIRSSTGPKLPSDKPYLLPKNIPIEFELKFKDPPKLVVSVSSDWKIGDYSVTNWQNTTIHHTFHKEGKYGLWATLRVTTRTKEKKSFSPIHKSLFVKEPVSLKVHRKHLEPEKKTWRFNISCNGSLPVSFLWCISKQCDLPPEETCSPTMEHNSSCSLIVNHTFSDPGNYCVNVGVINDVSGTNTSFIVQIPGKNPIPKYNSGKSSKAGVVITLLVAFILLVIVIIAAWKRISSKSKKTAEKADFEFRDVDALSVLSSELSVNRVCFTGCGVWGSRKTGEKVPFCRESCMYTV